MTEAPTSRNRLPDWEQRLNQVFTDWQTQDFAWGSTDCFQFAGACISAVTGTNHASQYIGIYNDPASALRLLSETLGTISTESLLNAWAEAVGSEVTGAQHLIKGDLIIKEQDGFLIHGIVLTNNTYTTRNGKMHSFASHNLSAEDFGVAI